jgi:hypothetical protein
MRVTIEIPDRDMSLREYRHMVALDEQRASHEVRDWPANPPTWPQVKDPRDPAP